MTKNILICYFYITDIIKTSLGDFSQPSTTEESFSTIYKGFSVHIQI